MRAPHDRLRPLMVLLLSTVSLLASPLFGQDMGEYRLGTRDLVEIRVLEVPELNLERRVSESGTLTLPLIGDLPVAGLTASEVQKRLETLLREKYVNRANVSIVIKEFANKPVSDRRSRRAARVTQHLRAVDAASGDFGCRGAYPAGRQKDLCSATRRERSFGHARDRS